MKRLKIGIIGTIIAGSILLSACDKYNIPEMTIPKITFPKINKKEIVEIKTEIDFLKQPSTNWASYKETRDVRSIYMTGYTIAWKARFHELVEFIDSTEINATVIDIKDDYGELTYSSMIPMVKEV